MSEQTTSAPLVDGFSVHVPNEYREEALSVFEELGLTPIDLDGRSGDDTEREIAAGSIDGDDLQDLAKFADVLDELDGMNIPYSAEVLAYNAYREAQAYMASRGRVEIRPTYKMVDDGRGPVRTHDGGFTDGDYELATSY